MLDSIYDDVLSIMKENGFTEWFTKNHHDKTSPLKWSYNNDVRPPLTPPKNINWLIHDYDDLIQYPITLMIDDSGNISKYI